MKHEIFETVDFWDIWSLRLSETASRFEVGTPSTVSFIGAAEAIKMLLNFGIEKVERRVLELTDYLIDKVKMLGLKLQTPEEPQHRSGLRTDRHNLVLFVAYLTVTYPRVIVDFSVSFTVGADVRCVEFEVPYLHGYVKVEVYVRSGNSAVDSENPKRR